MQPEPTGYRALQVRLHQCGRLTNDARGRLADTIQRAPHDAVLTRQLDNALVHLIEADQAIYNLIHVVQDQAAEEQRRSDQPTRRT